MDTEELTDVFNSVCLDIIKDVAPIRQKMPKPLSQPWFNNETRALRQACRKAERRWKRHKLQISFEMLQESLNKYQCTVKAARTKYFSDLINRTAHCPKALFSTINTVLNNPAIVSPIDSISHTCEDFLNYFIRKIESIREDSVLAAPLPSSCIFDCFDFVSLPVLEGIVKHMKLSHTPLDPIPPHFLKDLFEMMGPNILSIVNSSLINGVVPRCLKQAVVSPLLKKSGLDPTELNNFRPIPK